MKVLVTGAFGFIGRQIVSALSDQHEAIAVVRGPHKEDLRGAKEVLAMDLARPLDSRRLPAQVDVVLHLAQANVPFPEAANELFAVNTIATQQLLDYARHIGAQQFILASTGDVYGRRTGPCRETDAATPNSYYAVTKYASELLVQAYGGYFRPCVLRFFHPYGPSQSNRLIQKLAQRIQKQQPVLLNREDRPRLTPIYIDDVVRAIQRAIDSSYSGVVNIAGDTVVSMRVLADMIGSVIGRGSVFEERNETVGDVMGNNELMKRVFGSWPMVDLANGLSRTLKGKEDTGWQATL